MPSQDETHLPRLQTTAISTIHARKAVRPYASIIFVAWIVMGFLQQRDDAAPSRYRLAISDFRSLKHSSDRHDNIREQILVCKRRCELVNYACQTGWDLTT